MTGYTSAFAGLSALYARDAKGVVSERAGSSLACVATLVQVNMQGEEPNARGPFSKGNNNLNRLYQVGQKDQKGNAPPEFWIYTQCNRDLTEEAENWVGTRDEFIAKLKGEGFLAITRVENCNKKILIIH